MKRISLFFALCLFCGQLAGQSVTMDFGGVPYDLDQMPRLDFVGYENLTIKNLTLINGTRADFPGVGDDYYSRKSGVLIVAPEHGARSVTFENFRNFSNVGGANIRTKAPRKQGYSVYVCNPQVEVNSGPFYLRLRGRHSFEMNGGKINNKSGSAWFGASDHCKAIAISGEVSIPEDWPITCKIRNVEFSYVTSAPFCQCVPHVLVEDCTYSRTGYFEKTDGTLGQIVQERWAKRDKLEEGDYILGNGGAAIKIDNHRIHPMPADASYIFKDIRWLESNQIGGGRPNTNYLSGWKNFKKDDSEDVTIQFLNCGFDADIQSPKGGLNYFNCHFGQNSAAYLLRSVLTDCTWDQKNGIGAVIYDDSVVFDSNLGVRSTWIKSGVENPFAGTR